MNHFSQQLNMSHISQCKPLGWVCWVGGAFIALTLLSGCKEQNDYRFVLERIPAHYKSCFEQIVRIPDGPLSKKQLLTLVMDLRKSELRLQRCGRGAVKWVEAQHNAYYQHLR